MTAESPSRVAPYEILGKILRERRHLAGLSQVAFAESRELNLCMVQTLEAGRRRYLRGSEIDQIARALIMPPEKLWAILGLSRITQGEARYVSLA